MYCNRPPYGWICTLQPDHEGPCPAHEDSHTVIERIEWSIYGRLAMAKARYDMWQEAYDEAILNGIDVHARQERPKRRNR